MIEGDGGDEEIVPSPASCRRLTNDAEHGMPEPDEDPDNRSRSPRNTQESQRGGDPADWEEERNDSYTYTSPADEEGSDESNWRGVVVPHTSASVETSAQEEPTEAPALPKQRPKNRK